MLPPNPIPYTCGLASNEWFPILHTNTLRIEQFAYLQLHFLRLPEEELCETLVRWASYMRDQEDIANNTRYDLNIAAATKLEGLKVA